MQFAYHGRFLAVDAGSGASRFVEIPEPVLRDYLGGSGLGTWLMLEQGMAAADALAPEAPLAWLSMERAEEAQRTLDSLIAQLTDTDAEIAGLTSTRDASDYGGRIGSSPAAGFLPKDELSGAALRRFLVAPSAGGA